MWRWKGPLDGLTASHYLLGLEAWGACGSPYPSNRSLALSRLYFLGLKRCVPFNLLRAESIRLLLTFLYSW